MQRGLALAEYRALIMAFLALTGIPIVLNTSFNLFKAEPIVESPADAVRAFIAGGRSCEAQIGRLIMHELVITHRQCPLDRSDASWEQLVPRQRVDFRSEVSESAVQSVSERASTGRWMENPNRPTSRHPHIDMTDRMNA